MHFRLVIPPQLFAEMLAHAQAEQPNECCGLLAGQVVAGVGRCTLWLPLVNELASPTEFASAPASMFAAVRAMRAADVEVLAVYHSHPTSAPVPSARDRARNYSPSVMNLIIGLTTDSPTVRGWWLTAATAVPGAWECAGSAE
jgi:proteasome lid subunit RPN8/RPN11